MSTRVPMSTRFIISISLPAVVALAGGAAAGSPPPATLTFWSHSWTVDGEQIHGIAGEGTVYHPDVSQPAKLVRFVLMPADWPSDTEAMANPQLNWSVYTHTAPLQASQQLVDLRVGAAYVQLLDVPTPMDIALAADMRLALTSRYRALDEMGAFEADQEADQNEARPNAAVPKKPGEIEPKFDPSLPLDVEGFDRYIRDQIDKLAEELKRQPESGEVITFLQQISEDQAIRAYFRFWPLIFTHSVTVAAQGTEVVVASLNGVADSVNFQTFFKLIQSTPGKQAELSLMGGTVIPLSLDVTERLDIAATPSRVTLTTEQDTHVTTLEDLLAAGFTAAFP